MSAEQAAREPAPPRRQARKRKGDLVAPDCRGDCQLSHTVEQTAALLSCSPDTVLKMIEAGRLQAIECGAGLARKSRRVPHQAIYKLFEADSH